MGTQLAIHDTSVQLRRILAESTKHSLLPVPWGRLTFRVLPIVQELGPLAGNLGVVKSTLEKITSDLIVRHYPAHQIDTRPEPSSGGRSEEVDEAAVLYELPAWRREGTPRFLLKDAGEQHRYVGESVACGADATAESLDQDSVGLS
ncbi:hypothetical protein [Streptomyces albipurpureus]|uniref:Uncharacterized protein n=1 Tax=Streptomyces albipurpureus TaxID=2897419 RepID=A0ABT0UUJ0_9ACTN|nr:hypothetical protein [Streptomyces sp. CWNU-1]MCM2392057.1 hypothetical protein [Streptomyces sp. CWNU-1]